MNIQTFTGATAGNWEAPIAEDNQRFAYGPNRIAVYQQNWRGFQDWNTGMGLVHYPPVLRELINPQPTNQIYLGRNPAPYTSASPIPIGDYVLSQQQAYVGTGG
jgi:hypothetical protein